MTLNLAYLQDQLQLPVLTLKSALGLARSLLGHEPLNDSPDLSRLRNRLAATFERAEQSFASSMRGSVAAESASRAVDARTDALWSSLRDRLSGVAGLPSETFPEAAEARELLATIFSDGLGFLRESYFDQHTTMLAMLREIDSSGAAAAIDRLAGPQFLSAIRAVMPEYSRMVEDSRNKQPAARSELQQLRLELRNALQHFVAAHLTYVEVSEQDSWDAVTKVLWPVIQLRDVTRRKRRGGAEEVDELVDGDTAAAPPPPEGQLTLD